MEEKTALFHRAEWLGDWENFELYFDDPDPDMQAAWEEAEQAVRTRPKNLLSAFLFRHGAKRFWQDACVTRTGESPCRLGGWRVRAAGEDDVTIAWSDDAGETLGCWRYTAQAMLDKGLEGKPNVILFAPDAPPDCPYRYVLSMAPMPARADKDNGGLISHLHFQFSAEKSGLVKANGRLRHPHWYATMCDAEATVSQRARIVRALHGIPEAADTNC